jgi:hypothetical protein
MTTQTSQPAPAVFIERLKQAIRVVQEASTRPNVVFNIFYFASREDGVLNACIAGLCGLDPWFQEQGLITQFDSGIGDINIHPLDFFGTSRPFYYSRYPTELRCRDLSFQDGIDALNREIAYLEGPATAG